MFLLTSFTVVQTVATRSRDLDRLTKSRAAMQAVIQVASARLQNCRVGPPTPARVGRQIDFQQDEDGASQVPPSTRRTTSQFVKHPNIGFPVEANAILDT
jgi:hypothetical protein